MTILTILRSYSNSLAVVEAESTIQRNLQMQAETEYAILPVIFEVIAVAYHQDRVAEMIKVLQRVITLLEVIGKSQETPYD